MTRILLLLLLICTPAYAQDTPEPIKETDILPYLEQAIAFNHAVADVELLPDNAREAILKDSLKLNAQKALQKSFEFAKAQALIFDDVKPAAPAPTTGDDGKIHKGKLVQAMADANKNITDLQTRLAARGLSAATRERLSGELKLANAQLELIKTMAGIFSADDNNSGALSDQISVLSHTELDAAPEQPKEVVTKEIVTKSSAAKDDDAQEGDGMFKLSGSLFSFSRKQSQMDNLLDLNKALTEKNRVFTTSIRAALHAAMDAGKALSAQNSDDAKSMTAYRQSLAKLMTQYKQLSATIIPIGEMNVALEAAQRNLQEWNKLIGDDWSHILRQLILRLVILSIAIIIPLIGSAIAHRAIARYIKDPKRQKQLNIARRIALVTLLAFVIMANFITEFGSLATFAGFITAGLAVALQTVLVSLVAHFFFFGRYGIKAGDRVTISDVTGEVIQVGVLRLYIRELKEVDGKWAPSGKMVAFPNSILFQPSAFYKYVSD